MVPCGVSIFQFNCFETYVRKGNFFSRNYLIYCIDIFKADMNRLCRVCLNDSQFYSHIYKELLCDDILYEVLNNVCQLDVKLGDGLPKFVCCECHKKISQFESFKRQSHEGSATLQQMKCDLENINLNWICINEQKCIFGNDPFLEDDMPPLVLEGSDSEDNVLNPEYLVSVKMDDFGADPVHSESPQKVEPKHSAEESFSLEEDSIGEDLKVFIAPIRWDESGSDTVLESEGVVGSQEEDENQNVPQSEEEEKPFCNGNIALNMSEVDGNGIPEEGASEEGSVYIPKPERTVLNDRNTRAAGHGRIDEGTSERVKSSASKCKRRKHRNKNDLREVEHGGALVNINVTRAHAQGSVRGERIDNRKKKKDFVGEHSSRRRHLKGGGCGEELVNKLDKLDHAKLRYVLNDNVCKLNDGVRVTGSKSQLRKGERSERKRTFKCNFCDKEFNGKVCVRVHERLHTVERKFKCQWCEKAFLYNSDKKVHERVHTGEKPYKCKFCDNKFAQVSNLTIHERLHTGERPYKCKLCPSTFIASGNLKVHERAHKGLKPFKCQLCAKEFTRKYSLKMHVRFHPEER